MLDHVCEPHSHQSGCHPRIVLGRERVIGGPWVVVKLPQLLHSLSEKVVVVT
jgi:hypothetical protein